MHSIGIDLAKLGEPVGKVLIVGAKAENIVFAVVLDVDVPHIGVVDIQAAFNAHNNAEKDFKHNHAHKQEYLLLRAFFFIFCPACFQAALIA